MSPIIFPVSDTKFIVMGGSSGSEAVKNCCKIEDATQNSKSKFKVIETKQIELPIALLNNGIQINRNPQNDYELVCCGGQQDPFIIKL